MDAIAQYPPVAPSYSYPIYSNTRFALLRRYDVVTAKAGDRTAPSSYTELLNRDVLQPLVTSGTTSEGRAYLAFPVLNQSGGSCTCVTTLFN